MEDNSKYIKALLGSINSIREKYNKINEITGANYNVFNVLKLKSNEVVLHSRFIGDLLNPKGKHGRGDVFLKLFLEQVKSILPDNIDVCDNFRTPNAKLIVEEYIGVVKTDEGGRIDLVVKDGINTIVIENKIYAEDQKQQLVRYYNKYPKSLMIFLTLNGKAATSKSLTPSKDNEDGRKEPLITDVDYIRMSYKTEIKNWLEECVCHTTQFPFLRESLIQYLNIVKQLTGQSNSNVMNEEIAKEIFKSTSSIKAAKDIITNFDNGQKEIYKEFRNEIQIELTKKLNELNDKTDEIKFCINRVVDNKKWEETKTQIIFNNKEFNYCPEEGISNGTIFKDKLIFEFSRMYRGGKVNKSFYFGFRYDNANNNEEDYKKTADIQRLIDNNMLNETKLNNDFGKYWLAISIKFDNDSNDLKFNSPEFMVKLNNEKDRVEMVDKLANEMFNVINEFNKK